MSPSRLHLVLLAAMAACSEVPTDPAGPTPNLKPSGSPSYTVLIAPAAPGWMGFSPADINVRHEVIGVMNPEGFPSQTARRAAFWIAGSAAVPIVLPVPAGKTWSVAAGLSDNGIVGGHIFPAGVLWRPNGNGWDIVTLDDHAVVNDVRNDGSAVGTVYDARYDTFREDPQPAAWDAAGVLTRLPMPPSGRWSGGEAFAINAQGDIAGTFEERPSTGPTYIWGALWVREGEGYTPVVMQTGWARGLSDRTPDGRIYVTASGVRTAYRHTFVRTVSGTWVSDSVAVAGTAQDVDAAGNVVGTTMKSGAWATADSPFLLPVAGSLLKLPMPRSATGAASGLSNDGWIAGSISTYGGVVWKP